MLKYIKKLIFIKKYFNVRKNNRKNMRILTRNKQKREI